MCHDPRQLSAGVRRCPRGHELQLLAALSLPGRHPDMAPDASVSPSQRQSEAESPYLVKGRWRPLLYGILLILSGFGLYLTAVVLAGFSRLIPGSPFGQFLRVTLWYSGLP